MRGSMNSMFANLKGVRFFLFTLLPCITGVLALSGCPKRVPPAPAPAPVCQAARGCVHIDRVYDRSCDTKFSAASPDAFYIRNNHPDRDVRVNYTETKRYINIHKPDEVNKSSVVVPHRQTALLGCFRTKGLADNWFSQFSYAIDGACFVGDPCPAAPQGKLRRARPIDKTCLEVCDSGDPSCLKADLQLTFPQLKQDVMDMHDGLMKKQLPTTVSLAPLANLVNIQSRNTNCMRTDLELSVTGAPQDAFFNSGSTCSLTSGIEGNVLFDGFKIELPGEWSGSFSRKPGQFILESRDISRAPTLSVHDVRSNQWETDSIGEFLGQDSKTTGQFDWIFTANEFYCVRVRGDVEKN